MQAMKNRTYRMKLFLVTLFSTMLMIAMNSLAQKAAVHVDQEIVQIVEINHPKMLRFFLEDFMIPEENVAKMVIYDLSGDGFGERDIAKTYPGGKTYLLTPSDRAQKIMNKWSFGGNIKFTANFNDPPELYENAPDSVRAQGGIFAALLNGLRRNYKGIPIKLHLEQDDNVSTIEMWGFNPNLMKYAPPPVAKVPEKVPVMKLIYLEKSIVDSVFTSME